MKKEFINRVLDLLDGKAMDVDQLASVFGIKYGTKEYYDFSQKISDMQITYVNKGNVVQESLLIHAAAVEKEDGTYRFPIVRRDQADDLLGDEHEVNLALTALDEGFGAKDKLVRQTIIDILNHKED